MTSRNDYDNYGDVPRVQGGAGERSSLLSGGLGGYAPVPGG